MHRGGGEGRTPRAEPATGAPSARELGSLLHPTIEHDRNGRLIDRDTARGGSVAAPAVRLDQRDLRDWGDDPDDRERW